MIDHPPLALVSALRSQELEAVSSAPLPPREHRPQPLARSCGRSGEQHGFMTRASRGRHPGPPPLLCPQMRTPTPPGGADASNHHPHHDRAGLRRRPPSRAPAVGADRPIRARRLLALRPPHPPRRPMGPRSRRPRPHPLPRTRAPTLQPAGRCPQGQPTAGPGVPPWRCDDNHEHEPPPMVTFEKSSTPPTDPRSRSRSLSPSVGRCGASVEG